MTDSVIDLSARRHLRDRVLLTLECRAAAEPIVREFLVDTTLPAVQVIDLMAVGLGLAPSPTTLLELRRRGGAPRYAGRAIHHFDHDGLWDVTDRHFSEVVQAATNLAADLWIDFRPGSGWAFRIAVAPPRPIAAGPTHSPFMPVDPAAPLLTLDVSPPVFQAFQQARAGQPIPPPLRSALLRDGAGEHLAETRPLDAPGLVHVYFRMSANKVAFPWFGLLETYVTTSELPGPRLGLIDYLVRHGSMKLLKNGRIAVADTRRLVRESEIYTSLLESAYGPGEDPDMLSNSDEVPLLADALATLLNTPLTRPDGQRLVLDPDFHVERRLGPDSSYLIDAGEFLIIDILTGKITGDGGRVNYPWPEHILRPAEDARFSPTPAADDVRHDNYVDEPKVAAFVRAKAERLPGIPESARGRAKTEQGLVLSMQQLLAAADARDREEWSFPGLNGDGDAYPEEPPASVFGFGSPEELDPALLPGRRATQAERDFSGEVHHMEFAITLSGVDVPVARVMQLPVALDAQTGMQLMLLLFGWKLNHLHHLSLNQPGTIDAGHRIGIYPHLSHVEPFTNFFWGDSVELGQVLVPGGARVTLEYDYGDGWEMVVDARKVVRRTAGAHVVEATGACPPEGVGGPDGYAQLREILTRGPERAARKDPSLGLEWARELAERWQGLNLDTPQFGPGSYPLQLR